MGSPLFLKFWVKWSWTPYPLPWASNPEPVRCEHLGPSPTFLAWGPPLHFHLGKLEAAANPARSHKVREVWDRSHCTSWADTMQTAPDPLRGSLGTLVTLQQPNKDGQVWQGPASATQPRVGAWLSAALLLSSRRQSPTRERCAGSDDSSLFKEIGYLLCRINHSELINIPSTRFNRNYLRTPRFQRYHPRTEITIWKKT